MTENTNGPVDETGPNADQAGSPQGSAQLSDKAREWLQGKAWTPEIMAALNVASDPRDPDVVWIDWRDNRFPDGRIRYIHPDGRWRLAPVRCSRHAGYEELPDFGADPCAEDRLSLAPVRNRGSRGDRCDVRKALMGKGVNGLSRAARHISGAKRFLVVEGIGQHGAAASWAPDGWAVIGMNGCDGIHGATSNGPATELDWAEGAEIVLVFDADRHTNENVRAAAEERVPALLWAAGARSVRIADLRTLRAGGKDGLDDVLAVLPEVGGPGTAFSAEGREAVSRADALASLIDRSESLPRPAGEAVDPSEPSGFLDLGPYLDGTFVVPEPSVGAVRDDGKHLMYAGRWHTVIGLTGAGKTWFALAHVARELGQGNAVVYAHFEEPAPLGTIARLRALGLDDETIRKGLLWLPTDTRRPDGWSFGAMLDGAERLPALVVLDGINAAATQHGWSPDKPEAVGEYRRLFVTPATSRGATVLSLGHPPKSPDRQKERHGYGSTAWLDEVDGVGFRLEASNQHPFRPGATGKSKVLAVKDRYGAVSALGAPFGDREAGWFGLGWFVLRPSLELEGGRVAVTLEAFVADEARKAAEDPLDVLAARITEHLEDHGGRFATVRELRDGLTAAGVKFRTQDVAPALLRLVGADRLAWPEVSARASRPGWLVPGEEAEPVLDETG